MEAFHSHLGDDLVVGVQHLGVLGGGKLEEHVAVLLLLGGQHLGALSLRLPSPGFEVLFFDGLRFRFLHILRHGFRGGLILGFCGSPELLVLLPFLYELFTGTDVEALPSLGLLTFPAVPAAFPALPGLAGFPALPGLPDLLRFPLLVGL
ncbi:hypothetical protein SDC9_154589 [bioreactor metagenome]|uniref:Uncharacterized protein n=1 Tax=bioreactor metagenome TaxID=1076179 RepID=A0A645F428_9ZZZZ